MKTMTDDQARAYIACDGSLCPHCDSDDIDTADRDLPYMTVACNKCGETWQETYQLVGVNDYLTPDPAQPLRIALQTIQHAVNVALLYKRIGKRVAEDIEITIQLALKAEAE